jgi:Domain of unknown function (DUF1905)
MKPVADTATRRFITKLFKLGPDKGGWVFIEIPPEHHLPVTGGWGMSPVIARADGREWPTTIWREKSGRCLLPVPKKVRGTKAEGDDIAIELTLDTARASGGKAKPVAQQHRPACLRDD